MKLEDINFDEIAKDLSNMKSECIVVINGDYEVDLHNHGKNYYKAQAEFDELLNMTEEQLEQQDIIAFAYMSEYELCDTGSSDKANIDIIEKIYNVCDQVGLMNATLYGNYKD